MKKLLLFLFLLLSTSAFAQDPSTGVSVQIQPQTGNGRLCVDARGNRDQDGTPVFIYQCHGSENQRWTITSSVRNAHAIIGIGGYCLDVRGLNATANGTPAQLYKCHFGDNQLFGLTPEGRIIEARSGKCLTAALTQEGSPLILAPCQNTPQETFTFRH